jgi:hypothetical protein
MIQFLKFILKKVIERVLKKYGHLTLSTVVDLLIPCLGKIIHVIVLAITHSDDIVGLIKTVASK